MSVRARRAHASYLVEAVRAAGLPCVGPLDEDILVEPDIDPAEVWAAVAAAYDLTPTDLAERVAAYLKIEVANLDEVAPHIVKLLPDDIARQYQVCPLREERRRLIVATSDPAAIDAEQAIGFASGRAIEFAVAAPQDLQPLIAKHYSPERAMEGLLHRFDHGHDLSIEVVEDREPEAVGEQETEAAPVVKLTNLILREGIGAGASDIHIEPGRSGGAIRFRVDGVLRHYMHLPMVALNRVVSRIKVLAKLDIADRIRPQDGRTRIQVEDRAYDLRLSTVPTRDGEKAVIRILDPERVFSLDQLAMTELEADRFRALLDYRDGLVIVTGPTGSGKTTTLYAAIREISTGEQNIMTVEDPVEYELNSVNQIQVEVKKGVTFAGALRAILRQDPDVIFVGEIRDAETAEIAIQGCMTGHLVLATLHTNDAIGVVRRLSDLGVDAGSIASTLRGVLAQRLVRRVCGACAEPVNGTLTDEEQKAVERYGVQPTVRPVGCAECAGTGYCGRAPASEVVATTPELEQLIDEEAPHVALHAAAVASGFRTMRESVLEAVQKGLTTLAEVDRVLGQTTRRKPPAAETAAVLIVDDDPIFRKVARRHLTSAGYEVIEAVDGNEALARLNAGSGVSLVLLDLHMPGLDGHELLAEIRKNPATAGLPVITVTATSDGETEARLMEEGADDYLSKPFDPSVFLARVKGALRRAGFE